MMTIMEMKGLMSSFDFAVVYYVTKQKKSSMMSCMHVPPLDAVPN